MRLAGGEVEEGPRLALAEAAQAERACADCLRERASAHLPALRVREQQRGSRGAQHGARLVLPEPGAERGEDGSELCERDEERRAPRGSSRPSRSPGRRGRFPAIGAARASWFPGRSSSACVSCCDPSEAATWRGTTAALRRKISPIRRGCACAHPVLRISFPEWRTRFWQPAGPESLATRAVERALAGDGTLMPKRSAGCSRPPSS